MGKEKEAVTVTTYTKSQILESKQHFINKKDLLKALLKEDKQYSVDEVNKLVDGYMKRKVK